MNLLEEIIDEKGVEIDVTYYTSIIDNAQVAVIRRETDEGWIGRTIPFHNWKSREQIEERLEPLFEEQ